MVDRIAGFQVITTMAGPISVPSETANDLNEILDNLLKAYSLDRFLGVMQSYIDHITATGSENPHQTKIPQELFDPVGDLYTSYCKTTESPVTIEEFQSILFNILTIAATYGDAGALLGDVITGIINLHKTAEIDAHRVQFGTHLPIPCPQYTLAGIRSVRPYVIKDSVYFVQDLYPLDIDRRRTRDIRPFDINLLGHVGYPQVARIPTQSPTVQVDTYDGSPNFEDQTLAEAELYSMAVEVLMLQDRYGTKDTVRVSIGRVGSVPLITVAIRDELTGMYQAHMFEIPETFNIWLRFSEDRVVVMTPETELGQLDGNVQCPGYLLIPDLIDGVSLYRTDFYRPPVNNKIIAEIR